MTEITPERLAAETERYTPFLKELREVVDAHFKPVWMERRATQTVTEHFQPTVIRVGPEQGFVAIPENIDWNSFDDAWNAVCRKYSFQDPTPLEGNYSGNLHSSALDGRAAKMEIWMGDRVDLYVDVPEQPGHASSVPDGDDEDVVELVAPAEF